MYWHTAVRRINIKADYFILHARTLTYTSNCTLICGVEGGESWKLFRCVTL